MFASLHTAQYATRRVQSRGPLDRLFDKAVNMVELYSQRRSLAALDDARLADLGLSRSEAEAEAARPLWDTTGLRSR